MEIHETVSPEFVASFAIQRQKMMHQAGQILGVAQDGNGTAAEDSVARLTALLVASLEELKVAEEELLERHEETALEMARVEKRSQYHQQLFDLAPVALVLTDLPGAIRELNRAGAALLGRSAEHLMDKPLAGLISRGERATFREGLARLSMTVGVEDWKFTLERQTHSPMQVSASVHLITGLGAGTGSLIWHLRPLQPISAEDASN